MSSASEPSVEVLTAEVRVLQIGSKPVALSAARKPTKGIAIEAIDVAKAYAHTLFSGFSARFARGENWNSLMIIGCPS